MIFWDLGGAKNLRKIWKKYYDDSHGILFCIDKYNQKEYENALKTLGNL